MENQKVVIKHQQFVVTPKQQGVISKTFNSFIKWLDSLNLKRIDKNSNITFEFFEIDNTLKVDDSKNLYFNLEYLKKCSVDYFITIVLHEAYHFYINDIPNKVDAIRIRDFYANQMMLHIDIEADFYVAKFYKEKLNFNLDDYLKIYYSGVTVFKDDEVRPLKFERYLCSMLTIFHLFINDELAIYRVNPEAIRIFKKSAKVILHKGTHSETRELKLSLKNLNSLQDIYQMTSEITETQYVEKLKELLYTPVEYTREKKISPSIKFKKRNIKIAEKA